MKQNDAKYHTLYEIYFSYIFIRIDASLSNKRYSRKSWENRETRSRASRTKNYVS